MVVGEMPEGVDLLVVGGGPGGYVAALEAARRGRSVLLVDAAGKQGLGGVCLSVGCIPSKALIELAGAADGIGSWAGRGLCGPRPDVDLAAFQEWKQRLVDGLRTGVEGLLTGAGVEVRPGWFRFTRHDQGAVETGEEPPTHVRFKSCVLATGSRPVVLPHLPPDGTRILDSTDVLGLAEVPGRVAVVGGGYIGVELGTALAKLGAQVTLVEAADSLLPALGDRVAVPVARRLDELGVDVRTSTVAVADDGVRLTVRGPSGEEDPLAVDRVVVAVGRAPNTDDMGLDALGVSPGADGLLAVGSDRMLTGAVAAIGDITPGPALAHKATAEAHVAVDVLCGVANGFDAAVIPVVVFGDPEVATVGLTQAEVRAQGYAADVASFPLATLARARMLAGDAGFTQLVHERDGGRLLGAQVVGPHATELIAELALAVEMGANLEDLAETIHPHPVMSEAVTEAARVGLGAPVHVAAGRARATDSLGGGGGG
ncbi:MAG: dihydrolipoyl dehydrogenase [Streptosporangiales bacterium]|nr:dihydrolipoyl dehydrogenase [Streptosporangiales bacterium]